MNLDDDDDYVVVVLDPLDCVKHICINYPYIQTRIHTDILYVYIYIYIYFVRIFNPHIH